MLELHFFFDNTQHLQLWQKIVQAHNWFLSFYIFLFLTGMNQCWTDNWVYQITRKVDNWDFKIRGPDFNPIMIK